MTLFLDTSWVLLCACLIAGDLEDAFAFGQKCLEFADTKESGKSILKEIASRRGKNKGSEMEDESIDGGNEGGEGSASGSGTAARMRAADRPNSDDDDDEGRGGQQQQQQPGGGGGLEPMNLNFTP